MIKTPLKNASNRVLLAAFLSAVLMAWLCPANATEPLSWVRKPNQPAPAQFDTFHGESLDFRCTFTGFGALPFAGDDAPRLYYQTNGMGAAWWSIPATVSSNVLSATFTPDRDPGAERLSVFFGAPSNAYAAAQVRFRNSPGATPNNLDPPSVLDWQAELSAATNALASNVYTKEETDAKIVELAPPGITTNDVCAIVTNEVAVYTTNDTWTCSHPTGENWAPVWNGDGWYMTVVEVELPPSATTYTLEDERSPEPGLGDFIYTRIPSSTHNALGLARESDITNTVTKAYVEGLGIEAGISAATATNIAESVAWAATEGMLTAETDPDWNAEKGGYSTTGEVAQVSAAVGTLWSYVYGDSVWIAVTNYMRTIGGVSPSFQLWEVREGVTNLVYWSKEEITNVTHDLIHDCKTNLEATVRNAVSEMPDKAWSKYQSATGNESPDGVTIVSTPTIQLTGGGEWYRYIDVASNSVWFLKSNGLHTFGGDTNGYFRILDDEGNATFEVRKTDSYLVDAVASSVHFDESGNFCVSFQSNVEPVIYTTATLSAPNFLPQGEDPNVTVTWTQSGGVYTAKLEQTVKGPSLFAYAKVEVLGETVIRNTVPTDLQGGIMLNGVKYSVGTATIDNKTVLTLTQRN